MRVTSKQVKDFWRYMSRKYKFDIVQKQDAKEMELIGWALEQMGIMDEEKFMKEYSVTIPLRSFRKVYVPFEIGKGNQNQLKAQVINCCHEAKHAVQGTRDHYFAIKYLGSDTHRAYYEMGALRIDMEMYYFFTKRCLSPKRLAGKLNGYSIGKRDRRSVERHLKGVKKVVERGGVISGISKDAIRWWKRKLK